MKTILRRVRFCLLGLVILVYIGQSGLLGLDDAGLTIDQLVINLKDYIYSYYSMIQAGKIKPKEEVLREIKTIVDRQFNIKDKPKHLDSFEDLSLWLDGKFELYNKSINFFVVSDSNIVNCWLGDLLEKVKGKRIIWEQIVAFEYKVMDNLIISDFVDFTTQHNEVIDVGVRGNIIYYNQDAYKRRAKEIWVLLLRRSGGKDKPYNPLKSDRQRKRLYVKTWGSLFWECLNKNKDLEIARQSFIDEVVIQLKENSLFHELGHIYAREHLGIDDEIEEEVIAFITELRYGILPYESLDALVSSRWHSGMENYKFVSDKILTSLLSYIQLKQEEGNQDYKRIVVESTRSKKNIDNLYKLSTEQIRTISEYIYKKMYQ